MSKHPDIDKVRKYLIESGYPEDGDALLSLVAVEAELAPKTSNPHGFAEILADMDLIIEQEHGSEFGARSLKEHLISFRDRIESALASAEPVAYCDSEDPAKVANVAMGYGGHGCTVPLVYAHAQPAAKVEALGDGLRDYPYLIGLAKVLRMRGDPENANALDSVAERIRRTAPTPASVPDGWGIRRDRYVSGIMHIRTPDNRICTVAAGDEGRNKILFELAKSLIDTPPTNQEGAAP